MRKKDIESACLDCGFKSAQLFWKKVIGEPSITKKNFWGPGNDYMIWLIKI